MSTDGKKISLKIEYIPVLKKLKELNRNIEAKEFSDVLQIPYEKLMSGAIYTLQEEGLSEFTEKEQEIIKLTSEGKEYAQKGLPSRQLFNLMLEGGRKELALPDFMKEAEKRLHFSKKIFFVGISQLKRHKWLVSSKATGIDTFFVYNENPSELPEEKLLSMFKKNDFKKLTLDKIPKDLHPAIKNLVKRKLIIKERNTLRIIKLTSQGKKISITEIHPIEDEIQLISSNLIKSGKWKDNLQNLKAYEVEVDGPRIQVGKYHPITIIKNQVREVFHSLGFTEIRGPMVETAFYNFDCLYQPQDHPAREMHDTFYLKNPEKGDLPKQHFVDKIRAIHENGGDTGSTGWQYTWSPEIAQKALLRTHTTATTLRHLKTFAEQKENLPIKLFCIDRVFRNENLDKTHLAELQQIDGIIIDKHATLSDLIGQITTFYKKMGFKKVITRPGFFPYTEPSMEVSVYSEKHGWVEMGGSGIFRPEVTYAWGIKEPVRVLAWGLGLERLALLKLNRDDIRDLYDSPIDFLREVSY